MLSVLGTDTISQVPRFATFLLAGVANLALAVKLVRLKAENGPQLCELLTESRICIAVAEETAVQKCTTFKYVFKK